MGVAFKFSEPEKGGCGRKGAAEKSAENAGFSVTLVKQARAVLAYSRADAIAVRDGEMTLQGPRNIRAFQGP